MVKEVQRASGALYRQFLAWERVIWKAFKPEVTHFENMPLFVTILWRMPHFLSCFAIASYLCCPLLVVVLPACSRLWFSVAGDASPPLLLRIRKQVFQHVVCKTSFQTN